MLIKFELLSFIMWHFMQYMDNSYLNLTNVWPAKQKVLSIKFPSLTYLSPWKSGKEGGGGRNMVYPKNRIPISCPPPNIWERCVISKRPAEHSKLDLPFFRLKSNFREGILELESEEIIVLSIGQKPVTFKFRQWYHDDWLKNCLLYIRFSWQFKPSNIVTSDNKLVMQSIFFQIRIRYVLTRAITFPIRQFMLTKFDECGPLIKICIWATSYFLLQCIFREMNKHKHYCTHRLNNSLTRRHLNHIFGIGTMRPEKSPC